MDPDIKESAERDGATIICINGQIVQFHCECGAHHEKRKSAICKTSGAFCKDCTNKNTSNKRLNKRTHPA